MEHTGKDLYFVKEYLKQ